MSEYAGMPTFNEWLQELSEEDEAWYIKEYGDLETAYNAEYSAEVDRRYDEYKDLQIP